MINVAPFALTSFAYCRRYQPYAATALTTRNPSGIRFKLATVPTARWHSIVSQLAIADITSSGTISNTRRCQNRRPGSDGSGQRFSSSSAQGSVTAKGFEARARACMAKTSR